MNNIARAVTFALGLAFVFAPGLTDPAFAQENPAQGTAPAQGAAKARPFPPPPKIAPPAPGSFPSYGAAPLGNMDTSKPPQPENACMTTFLQLRHKTEERGQALQALQALSADPQRRPTPEQGCTAYTSLVQAMSDLLKFVEGNAAKCGIPAEVAPDVKALYERSEAARVRICDVAQGSGSLFPKP